MTSAEYRDDSGTLCHVVFRPAPKMGRIDITPSEALLQVASICPEDGTSFAAHRHIPKKVGASETPTQESWVVLEGEVTVVYFDSKGNEIGKRRLSRGDVTLTFEGGHAYEDTMNLVAVEFKSGPYLGQSFDKVFLKP